MIDTNLFFSQFQVNYFDYKINSLKYLLDNHSKLGFDKEIFGYTEKSYVNAIRSDIRQTYFQAIETVFEIFFALLPDRNGKIHDKIIERITLSDLPYSDIRKISKSENSLDFLDNEIIYPDKTTLTLGEFIFYFGLHNEIKFKESIEQSLDAIKYALRILAKEFTDRREYNSYKHGLRIIPALQKLDILDAETMKKAISFELKDTMTFYSYDKKTNETSFITKKFDTERDLQMISVCSNLLWTMITLRDAAYNKAKKDKDSKIAILFFGKEEIDKAKKINVDIQDLKFSERPINN